MSQGREYEIQAVIGQGGFGTVLRAKMRSGGGFSKTVAIKILHDELAMMPKYASRLRDEARLLGLVRHRAILQVDELAQLEGRWAVVAEYVEGASLLDIVMDALVPETVMLEIITEVAGALHAAYQTESDGVPLKLIHRDIKPGNIQLTELGEVKLLDFGIARADHEARESQTTAVLMGSPNYMSPERMEMVDLPAGDVYGLGVVLCEGITSLKYGRTSGNVERHEETLNKNLARLRQHASPQVVELAKAMLAYSPEDRPTAREVERTCREIRGKLEGPWLGDWAQEILPKYMEPGSTDHVLVGRTLTGDDATPDVAPVVSESPPPPPPIEVAPRRLGLPLLLGLFFITATLTAGAIVSLLWGTSRYASLVRPNEVREAPLPVDPPKPEPIEELAVSENPEPASITDVPTPSPVVAPRPSPKPAAKVAAPRVSYAQFSAFVEANPEWTAANAVAAGKADDKYLGGWNGSKPPAERSGPVVHVSWWAAIAYCQGRGGLPDATAQPVAWSSEEVVQELRVLDGAPGWLRYDGLTSQYRMRKSSTSGMIGFRCAQ